MSVPIDNRWIVADIRYGDQPDIYVIHVADTLTQARYEARFDGRKRVFLDDLPVTIDAMFVLNIIRTLVT